MKGLRQYIVTIVFLYMCEFAGSLFILPAPNPNTKSVPVTTSTPTTEAMPSQNVLNPQPQPTRQTPRMEDHPCNRERRSRDFKLKQFKSISESGKKVVCRRLGEAELLAVRNCSGTFKQTFSADTLALARKNAVKLIKKTATIKIPTLFRKTIRKTKKIIAIKTRAKRDASNMAPNTTEVCEESCADRFSIDPLTGLGLPCGICPTVFRQATANRYPQYVNGIICHPNETVVLQDANGNNIGECVQQTFTQDFLQWTGEWEVDEALTAQLPDNQTAYKEKWEPYSHTINSGCSFQFYLG